MSRTDSQTTASPLAEFRLTRAVASQWLVVSVVGFFAFAYTFGRVLAFARGRPLEPIVISPPDPASALGWIVVSVALVGTVVILHELLHGVAMRRYGGTPSYGVGVSQFVFPAAYATSGNAEYTRTQLIVVLIAPFVGLTGIGLALMAVYPTPLVLVVLAVNAAGSVGDLWMASILAQYPDGAQVVGLPDDERGFALAAPNGDSVDRLPRTVTLSRLVVGSIGTLVVLVASVLLVVFGSLAFGTGTVVIGDPTGRWFLVRHELRSGVAHLEVGASFVVGTSAVAGFVWALLAGILERTSDRLGPSE
ncbi:DUF3267 domain-containing protein [Natrarchaeobius halalkaliphilus]|uniref:DUF3267 domain-containing protein n=1 Tax=Natrarchaeobius halalkaliphilus TaxID=1679091 RepID=A0A3N6M8X1_9EURY|nr:DUF3267 domain-containing protein [Natrarchaeobius halalkaliphilus]RQG89926.1 DUF3267 domain-containing protein [Natrarchaeobius halalkaliphilus]